ncbi:NADH dehydrogenase [ubiquinone] 1 alpha subcomplex assembly factor 4 isoform X1 [Acanthochromis polyacanthus]|uniref:NADH dehydrogenase [ubiquinone] 1 alpha subcomplex assembly factor 4 n=1 Tax=Acanthochromis polyacanthus TaxID=80966 RepID=A0A3Q1HQT8_9TELE|nr:NADH dehydrogenase [ubiquinone] 1 alpha subcomplex assembly factor 4 isoform X1 [Acanthochromis polyacanthus]
MGARVGRMFRNFNLENRVHRELAKEKPRMAPRHPDNLPLTASSPEAADAVNQKNDTLLTALRSVYVESTDPVAAPAEDSKAVTTGKETGRRPLKFSLPGDMFGTVELTDVPKGKLTIVEAMKALGGHQHQPQTWTPEKIAQEYCLDLKDTKAVLEFFVPFKVEIIPPKSGTGKQIKAS